MFSKKKSLTDAQKHELEIERICEKQAKMEKEEINLTWKFVFGNSKPKKKKEIYKVPNVTLRNVWMEPFFLFKQIKSIMHDEFYHDASSYALQWQPPGSSYRLIIPLDDPSIQERVIIQISKMFKVQARQVLFFFCTIDPALNLFAPRVHPSSLVSYRTKTLVLKKLADLFLAGKISLEEFNKIMSCGYEVWRLALFNLLTTDEQKYHMYLNEVPEVILEKQSIEKKYLHDNITLQEYEDLKFPERKKRKDAEAKTYPLPYDSITCVVCGEPDIGIIKCQNCDNMACVQCVHTQFLNPSTSKGSFLLLHRTFCLRLGCLPAVNTYLVQEPAYLRELRRTGRSVAVEALMPKTDGLQPLPSWEDTEADLLAEQLKAKEEKERIEEEERKEREREIYERDCPIALREIQVHIEVDGKKIQKILNEINSLQAKIEEPGHTEQFCVRQERLRQEQLEKLRKVNKSLEKQKNRVIALNLEGEYVGRTFVDIDDIRQRDPNFGTFISGVSE